MNVVVEYKHNTYSTDSCTGDPHNIAQRGNCRMETFFAEAGFREYLFMMVEWCNRCKVQIWSYLLFDAQLCPPNRCFGNGSMAYCEG